ncbi:MAG: hypothetical protein LBK53_06495 [Heliobacteriaceae bacterium]|nr:hypothetical protein [Heliobacteriaceae bacterium]
MAGARTNKLLEIIKLLGNCSNTGNYEYTEDDVRKIFGALEKELKAAKIRFEQSSKKDKFRL